MKSWLKNANAKSKAMIYTLGVVCNLRNEEYK